ncbi:hypothetical protein RA276_27435 [Pseudomonas syringae pv. tagetis]|uniref:hypothetical protein n=1 Tax=Pseudomonas syringae group genomosp. 7 TaxID=251699 RepID=UPI00376F6532
MGVWGVLGCGCGVGWVGFWCVGVWCCWVVGGGCDGWGGRVLWGWVGLGVVVLWLFCLCGVFWGLVGAGVWLMLGWSWFSSVAGWAEVDER